MPLSVWMRRITRNTESAWSSFTTSLKRTACPSTNRTAIRPASPVCPASRETATASTLSLQTSEAVNSTYHLFPLSTQHPQYQNQLLNSPPFFTVGQFPLTRKMKKSGNWNLSSDKPRLPEIPCFLHFFAILFFDF